ncbi:MAG: CaiB/BaiF CoA transferase family protein [Alphaproteobacteria bacterium]
MRALEAITVLDLTHMLSGPYAGMLMADMGARTIKVEPPGRGEGTRRLLENDPEHSRLGMGAYFLTLNRNKQSVAIDLKVPEGRALFLRLAEKADVVLNNITAGVPERLGIDYAALSAVNPRIITCSLTGFGETGPGRDRAAFDLVAQGMGGGMSVTGYPDGEPLRAGLPIGDLGGGLFAVIGILAALQARQVTGRGQHVDISMMDGQISLLNYMATMQMLSGRNPPRAGNGHFVHVPYNTFRTKTRYLILAVLTDDIWTRVVDILAHDDLRDPRYTAQPGRLAAKAELEARVQAVLETEPCEHWLPRFEAARVPCAPVNDIAHAMADPQTLARAMKVSVPLMDGTTVDQPGNPIKLSETHEDCFTPPPAVGEHTAEILTGMLGLSDEDIARLAGAGIIGGPVPSPPVRKP